MKKTGFTIFFAFLLVSFSGSMYFAAADGDKGRSEKHGERKRNSHEGSLKQISNPTYKKECGACHFAYQPELLPSASWMKILDNLDDHFGESVDLGDDSMRDISHYLKSDSAENSSSKRAVRIMRSLGSQVPMRITDIRYIQDKHHDISSDVLKRKSVGSLSNCSACHTGAERGIYDDDNVTIPE